MMMVSNVQLVLLLACSRMRDLGYPPAWKRFAQVNHSGLSLYMDRGRVLTAEETTNGEDGELEQDFDEKQVQYDAEKLQEWPGFNTDPPKGTQDESRYYRLLING